MKKYFSRITLAMMVALVMSLGVALPAMAADSVPANEFSITKLIETPEGTTIPESLFEFNFDQLMPLPGGAADQWILHNGSASATATIPMASVTFAEGDEPTATAGNIFAGATWPHAGEFVFRITETPDTNPAIAADPDRTMEYSEQVFVIVVRVSNDGSGGFTPTQVAIFDPSVTPRPGADPGNIYSWGTAVKIEEVVFINEYTAIIGDIDDPAFEISKTIEGEYANLTTLFDFSVRFQIPAGVDFPTPFEAWIINASAETTVSVTVDVIQPQNNPQFIGVDTQLGHGERLVFPQLPAGTSFRVIETQQDNFDGVAVITLEGSQVATISPGIGVNVDTDLWAMPGAPVISDNGDPNGDLSNSVAFTNTYVVSPLTGLIIGSMPFLVGLLVALLILAMMVASRQRRRIEELPVAYG